VSIYIKGVNPPSSCWDCAVHYGIGIDCPTLRGETSSSQHKKDRPDGCPIEEVPSHGKLIDADRLLTDRMKSKYYHLPNGDIAIPLIDVEHAPIVIEGDGEQ